MTDASGPTFFATPIPGLTVIDLPLFGDSRGWFKENWQHEKTRPGGSSLANFRPVQNNISFNDEVGTTRGIHAEPWDKYVSVASGRAFGAWVDLRRGPTFGLVHTAELTPSRAVFVPRGVGNAFQTLTQGTAYTYLVNDHWSPQDEYAFLNLADETVGISWPIPLDEAVVSQKDRNHPRLVDVRPIEPRKILVTGADGQLGRALGRELGDRPWVEFASRDDLDVSSPGVAEARRWRDYSTIVNAAAFTDVDRAETLEGRRQAWAANVTAVSRLARVATEFGLTLVHVSSDYVFDGTKDGPYLETDSPAPLGVYGQTKAAADAIVSVVPQHYVVRTSWVVGEGTNFVSKMAALAAAGVSPEVVDDQVGRLTEVQELARAIRVLLDENAPYGVYHVTGPGPAVSWWEVAREVFDLTGKDPATVRPVSSSTYELGTSRRLSPRPQNGVLDTRRWEAIAGVSPTGRRTLREQILTGSPDVDGATR